MQMSVADMYTLAVEKRLNTLRKANLADSDANALRVPYVPEQGIDDEDNEFRKLLQQEFSRMNERVLQMKLDDSAEFLKFVVNQMIKTKKYSAAVMAPIVNYADLITTGQITARDLNDGGYQSWRNYLDKKNVDETPD